MNEDFVTFELAKKLNEKGFDRQTFDWYDYLGNFNKGMMPRTLQSCPMRREYYAPTIGLALKWLREEKSISIEPCATPYNCWYYMIKCKGEIKATYIDNKYKTYEAAAITGIEYCLHNLI